MGAPEHDAALARPDPPVVLARDVASRGAREMVLVDGRGRAVTPWRATRPLMVMAGLGGLVAGLGGGWLPLATLGVLSVWTWPSMRRQLRGNALALHGRFDEAASALEPLARSPLAEPAARVMARSTLAYISACRGDHEAALAWARKGARARWPRVAVTYCRLAEVDALVNLDRLAEARAVFDRHLRRAPRGDALLQRWWEASLYLAFAEGAHDLDAEQLHARARAALLTTSARTLLALLAWAHDAIGDADQASHLLREALAREDVSVAHRSWPRLHAWIEERRSAALAAAPADDD